MDKKIIEDTILDFKNKSNKDLEYTLKGLGLEFEGTKKLIIKLSKHLDNVESNYNKILKEYNNRTGNG
jgi:hypothetical protein